MKRFKSARQAQRFLPPMIRYNLLLLHATKCLQQNRAERARAFQAWHDVCGITQAA